jgi:hypothetical protein
MNRYRWYVLSVLLGVYRVHHIRKPAARVLDRIATSATKI